MGRRVFGTWKPPGEPCPEALTPIAVRDLITDCFVAAHGCHFRATRNALGLSTDDDAVRESSLAIVKLAFRQVGGDYDMPSTRDLPRVVNLLAERSLGWGTPVDLVFEHHCSIMRTIGRSLNAGN